MLNYPEIPILHFVVVLFSDIVITRTISSNELEIIQINNVSRHCKLQINYIITLLKHLQRHQYNQSDHRQPAFLHPQELR